MVTGGRRRPAQTREIRGDTTCGLGPGQGPLRRGPHLARPAGAPGRDGRLRRDRPGARARLEDIEVQGQGGLVIWEPRSGRETQITTSQVLSHLQDIRIAWRRFHDAVAAESSAEVSGT